MLKSRNVNMLSGSITKGLLALAIPIMIMNVMQSLFNIIDMAALRHFSDDNAVGAVGICSTVLLVFTNLLIGLSTGANVVIAKHFGAKQQDNVNKAVMTALLVSVAGGFILLFVGVTFAEPLLKMTNCPAALFEQAVLYFKIYFYGVPVLMLYTFCAAILRAVGDTKSPMYFLILGGALKVIFSVLFLAAFDMSVDGVGYATMLSNAVAGVLALSALLKKKEDIRIEFKKLRFYGAELKETLHVGVPAGIQTALYSLANIVIVSAVNKFGADATTGVSIANQFDNILYQISCATSIAIAPYVAQNIGAKNLKRAGQSIVRGTLITVAFGLTFGMLSATFSRQLSSLMTSSPAIIEYSRQKMIIISSTYFICGINEILGGALRGMGKPIIPTISTLIFMCLIRFVWVYAIFPLYPNLTFLYLIWPIGWVLSIITQLAFFFPTMKKLRKQLPQPS